MLGQTRSSPPDGASASRRANPEGLQVQLAHMTQVVYASHAAQVGEAFVEMAESPAGTSDTSTLLRTLVDQCVILLEATAAGLILADGCGNLHVIASTSEECVRVEESQYQSGAGPCLDAYRSGNVVTLSDIAEQGNRYPEFQSVALTQGYKAVHAIPMRYGSTTIGALNLFLGRPGVLSDEDAMIGRALADVATISLLHERTARKNAELNAQLQSALTSRVSIEQAKGIISARNNIEMNEAFLRLRAHARSHEETMQQSATNVIKHLAVI